MSEFTDTLTKEETIDRQSEMLERVLEALNEMFIKIGGDDYDVELYPGNDFPKDFMIPTHPITIETFKLLWAVREEICGNSAFLVIKDEPGS